MMSLPAMTTTTVKPGTDHALAVAEQYEHTALRLRQTAHELEALGGMPDVENQAYWEWTHNQPPTHPLRLPIEFTRWTLVREAELLEARARVLRGGERNG